jgi:hypothetical protein
MTVEEKSRPNLVQMTAEAIGRSSTRAYTQRYDRRLDKRCQRHGSRAIAALSHGSPNHADAHQIDHLLFRGPQRLGPSYRRIAHNL